MREVTELERYIDEHYYFWIMLSFPGNMMHQGDVAPDSFPGFKNQPSASDRIYTHS